MERNKSQGHFKNMLTFAAGAALGAAVYKALSHANVEAGQKTRSPLELLIQKQIVVQRFDTQDAKGWFLEQTGGEPAGSTLLLAYPTEKLLEKYGYEGAEELDRGHYLLLAVLNPKGAVEKMALVNFVEIDEGLRDLLEENGGIVYVDG